MAPDRMMWAAHALTVARVPLAATFWYAAPHTAEAVAVLAAAAASDLADGPIARRARRDGAHGAVATAGNWLDPLCDKLFAVTVLAALALRLDVPLAMLALIGARELIVGPLVIAYRLTPLRRRYDVDFEASRFGKIATATQFLAIAAVLLRVPGTWSIAVICAAVGVAAAAGYLVRTAEAAASRTPAPNLR